MEIKIESSDYVALDAAIQQCKLGQDRLSAILQAVQRDIVDQRAETNDRLQLLEYAAAGIDLPNRVNASRRPRASPCQRESDPVTERGQNISHDECDSTIDRHESDHSPLEERFPRRRCWYSDAPVERYRTRIVAPDDTTARSRSSGHRLTCWRSRLARNSQSIASPINISTSSAAKPRHRARGDDLTINMDRAGKGDDHLESRRLVRQRNGWRRARSGNHSATSVPRDVTATQGRTRARPSRKTVSFVSPPDVGCSPPVAKRK